LLAVSGVLGWRNLRGIEAELGLPAEVFEGQAFGLPLRLRHRGGRRARDLLLAVDGAPAGHFQARLEGRGRWAEGWLRLPPAMRGRHLLAELRLASYYPFGFLRRGNRRKLGLSVLVYPRLLDGFNTPPAPPGAWEGESARRRHPSGDE